MNRRVVITGMGAVTPIGNDLSTTWENMVAGKSGMARVTLFDPSPYGTHFGGEIKDFDPNDHFGRRNARRLSRFVQFAVVAAREAVADAQLEITEDNAARVGVVIGAAIGSTTLVIDGHEDLKAKGPRRVNPFAIPMLTVDAPSGQVAIDLGAQGFNIAVVTACSTGACSIGEAYEAIKRGDADAIIAGGADEPIIEVAFAGFNIMKVMTTRNDDSKGGVRPYDADRDGFALGEGAAILVLEELEHAQARGARIYAEVVGFGAAGDAFHMAAPAEDGGGLKRAMRMALRKAEELGVNKTDIDYLNPHGSATRVNDTVETKAFKDVFGDHAYKLAISSTKALVGHMMGGAGAIETLACVKAIESGMVHPTINLHNPDPECDLDYVPNAARQMEVRVAMNTSMGLGGHNVAVILRKYE